MIEFIFGSFIGFIFGFIVAIILSEFKGGDE